MNTELNNRTVLAKIVECMNDSDTKQILAYAAGYEAGKINRIHSCTTELTHKPSEDRLV